MMTDLQKQGEMVCGCQQAVKQGDDMVLHGRLLWWKLRQDLLTGRHLLIWIHNHDSAFFKRLAEGYTGRFMDFVNHSIDLGCCHLIPQLDHVSLEGPYCHYQCVFLIFQEFLKIIFSIISLYSCASPVLMGPLEGPGVVGSSMMTTTSLPPSVISV